MPPDRRWLTLAANTHQATGATQYLLTGRDNPRTASGVTAQEKGTVEPTVLPPVEHLDNPKTPAKQLFGRIATPTPGHAHVVGFYSAGCLAGASALPVDGPEKRDERLDELVDPLLFQGPRCLVNA